MHRPPLILRLVLILTLLAGSVGRAAAPVRVATFNLYNYLEMDRRVDGRFRPNYPKPEKEKAAIRAVIRAVQPDILALQEIGPAPYLEELRRDLVEEGWVFPYSQLLEAADPERHVAVLSRVPFAHVTPHPEVEFKYFEERELVKRGLLEVAFDSPSGEWTLFIVHLKSRYTDRPDDPLSAGRREDEATAVRDVIVDEFSDPAQARFLIAGDFNDTTGSKAVARMLRRGKRVISELLPTADTRGEAWTYRYLREDTYSRSDYLLASPHLRPHVVGGVGHVFDAAGAMDGTDHRLVYVDLDLDVIAEPAATDATATLAAPGSDDDGTAQASEDSGGDPD